MNSQEIELLEIPLGIEAHRHARQFAAEQTTNEKSKQVYLNTLAVYAVHRYLQWLQIETDLSQSESWHPVLRRQRNVADLFLPGIGNLECCPVLPGETSLYLPPKMTEDRIAYLAVGLNESLTEATLLGFTDKVSQETLPLSQLGSLEDFLEQVNFLEPVHLSQWFENIFKKGWKRSETLIPQLAVRFQQKPRVTGAKQIDLGTKMSGCPLDLVLTLTEKSSQRIRIEVHVCCREGEKLPEGLKLIVIEESGETFSEVSNRINNNIGQTQLKGTGNRNESKKRFTLNENLLRTKAFSGYSQEIFTIKLVLGEAIFTENFIV